MTTVHFPEASGDGLDHFCTQLESRSGSFNIFSIFKHATDWLSKTSFGSQSAFIGEFRNKSGIACSLFTWPYLLTDCNKLRHSMQKGDVRESVNSGMNVVLDSCDAIEFLDGVNVLKLGSWASPISKLYHAVWVGSDLFELEGYYREIPRLQQDFAAAVEGSRGKESLGHKIHHKWLSVAAAVLSLAEGVLSLLGLFFQTLFSAVPAFAIVGLVCSTANLFFSLYADNYKVRYQGAISFGEAS